MDEYSITNSKIYYYYIVNHTKTSIYIYIYVVGRYFLRELHKYHTRPIYVRGRYFPTHCPIFHFIGMDLSQ